VTAPSAAEEATAAPAPAAARPLPEWIREHRVCWETIAHFELHHRAKVMVGFDLTLLAAAPRGVALDPGGPEAVEIHTRLRALLRAVLPEGTHFELEPFDSSFHLRAENEWEPEVELTAEILPDGTFESPDEAVRRQVREVEERLARLGVRPRLWREGPRREAAGAGTP
jgi:hypothetical protein